MLTIDPLRSVVAEHGVFLRREATALGFNDADLARSLRAGALVRVRHGCYTFADAWEPLDADERHVVSALAVMRRVRGVALSHHSGALVHGMQVWGADLRRVHVTRLDGAAGRTEGDVVHHEGVVGADGVTARRGVAVLPAARTALETGILLGTEGGLVTASSGLRRGLFTIEQLAHHHEVMQAWPGARPLQIVTRLADPAFESVGEVRSAYLFWRAGLPRPVPQHEVYDDAGRLVGRVDFAWPEQRLVVEFDGAEKYWRFAREGERPGDVVFREKRREDDLRAAGWCVVRLTWSDLQDPREAVGRIRRALAGR